MFLPNASTLKLLKEFLSEVIEPEDLMTTFQPSLAVLSANSIPELTVFSRTHI